MSTTGYTTAFGLPQPAFVGRGAVWLAQCVGLSHLVPPAVAPKPSWARVSRRAWRRHSALLTCLHEGRDGADL